MSGVPRSIRTAHGVWKVHPRVAKGDASEQRGEHHLMPGLGVGGVGDGTLQVVGNDPDGGHAADVGPGVAALGERAGVRWS